MTSPCVNDVSSSLGVETRYPQPINESGVPPESSVECSPGPRDDAEDEENDGNKAFLVDDEDISSSSKDPKGSYAGTDANFDGVPVSVHRKGGFASRGVILHPRRQDSRQLQCPPLDRCR